LTSPVPKERLSGLSGWPVWTTPDRRLARQAGQRALGAGRPDGRACPAPLCRGRAFGEFKLQIKIRIRIMAQAAERHGLCHTPVRLARRAIGGIRIRFPYFLEHEGWLLNAGKVDQTGKHLLKSV